MLRGWLSFYRTGVRLGLRSLFTGHFTRDALLRVLAPVEDTRLYELPNTLAALEVEPGQRVLDLASPKLAAVCLARGGAEVTSVDAYEPEIAAWRVLAGHVRGLSFQVADARRLPFPDETFDHAYSISVIEHIGEDGDFQALAELARVVKPGGRIVITVPYAASYGEDWREAPLYGTQTQQKDGLWFFSRTYDDDRLAQLVAATPLIRSVWSRAAHFESSRLYRFYHRHLPMSVVLSPLLGWTLRVVEAPGGLMMLALVRVPANENG